MLLWSYEAQCCQDNSTTLTDYQKPHTLLSDLVVTWSGSNVELAGHKGWVVN